MPVLLADAGDGDETAFRDGFTESGMLYAKGILPTTTVWAPGTEPLALKDWSGRGAKPTRLGREPGHGPAASKTLAMNLDAQAYCIETWREGSNTELCWRFAGLWVRPAQRDTGAR